MKVTVGNSGKHRRTQIRHERGFALNEFSTIAVAAAQFAPQEPGFGCLEQPHTLRGCGNPSPQSVRSLAWIGRGTAP